MNKPDITYYQERLLEESRRLAIIENRRLSTAVEEAFLQTPRHRFIQRYRATASREWQEVTTENLAQHLPFLYSNNAIGLYGDEERMPSTISQPSLVLYMLELLQVQPGHRVFELGAGSGWNAALLGRLVGSKGHVYSLEIIPEMVARATTSLATLGIDNVSVINADGGAGYAQAAPFDRAIFTAGAYDLPRSFHEQLRPGGLLLFVFKLGDVGDALFLLQKEDTHFRSLETLSVGFVPMTGAHAKVGHPPQPLSALPDWETLHQQEIERRSFWWGGRGVATLLWRTRGVRSFLTIVEPWFRTFRSEENAENGYEEFFGLWDAEGRSLTIARNDELITYGNLSTRDRLYTWLRRWNEWGMPAADGFALSIYPADATVAPGTNEWLMQRPESTFLWRLPIH